jgi:hypothetical protein
MNANAGLILIFGASGFCLKFRIATNCLKPVHETHQER